MTEKRFGDVTLRAIQGTPVLTLTGQIDISNVRDLQQGLAEAPESEELVVDMSTVDFLDSTALAALVRYRNAMATNGTAVTLVITSPLVRRIFDITNFDREFTIVARLEDIPGLFPKA